MTGLGRARLAGTGGTILQFVNAIALLGLSYLVSSPSEFRLIALLMAAVPWFLLLYALRELSVEAGKPSIFGFYMLTVVLAVAANIMLAAGSQLNPSSSDSTAGALLLALVIGWYGSSLASAFFLFGSFARIADTLGYRWFLWSGRLIFVGAATTIVPLVGPFVGLAGYGLQLYAFYSLGGTRQSPRP